MTTEEALILAPMGLDPRLHLFRDKFYCEEDGQPWVKPGHDVEGAPITTKIGIRA